MFVYDKMEVGLMKYSLLKKYWWVIFILIVVITPILINCLILHPAFFSFVGEDTDWLNFWGTYISAIASFAMVFITWRTLQQNKEQLNELKRQWEEENRPILDFYFVKDEIIIKGYRIEVLNLGKRIAYDIKLYINDAVINVAPNENIKNSLKNIGSTLSILLPNESAIINLCEEKVSAPNTKNYKISQEAVTGSEYENFSKAVTLMNFITISGEYNSKYKFNKAISLKNKRNRYKDASMAIAEVSEAINTCTFNIAERGIIVKEQKNETK